MSRYWSPGLGPYLLRHPSRTSTLVRAGWRLRRRDWWRHAPFLPLPDPTYWDFRMSTISGSPAERLTPQAMVDAATWSLRQRVGR